VGQKIFLLAPLAKLSSPLSNPWRRPWKRDLFIVFFVLPEIFSVQWHNKAAMTDKAKRESGDPGFKI